MLHFIYFLVIRISFIFHFYKFTSLHTFFKSNKVTYQNNLFVPYISQSLTDLENSRDDLLYELHKLPNQATADTNMLKAYFEDVHTLSQLLEKQLRLVLSRTLNTVRKEPTVIVTALRIIEREEKADIFALQVSIAFGCYIVQRCNYELGACGQKVSCFSKKLFNIFYLNQAFFSFISIS